MSKTSSLSRNISIDAVKGIASIGVVIIHASGYMEDTNLHVWLKAICRFAVPVFVFFFVYFLELTFNRKNDIFKITLQKLTLLGIPFIFWTALYILIAFFHSKSTEKIPIVMHLLNWQVWTYQGWAGQYFFVVLFQSILLLAVLRQLSSVFWVVIAVISLIFNSAIIYWHPISTLQKFGYLTPNVWLPYLCMGLLFAQHLPKLPIMPFWLRLLTFLSPNLIAVELLYTVGTDESIVYLFPSIFISSTLIVLTASSYGEGRFTRLLSRVGQSSMAVFCMNPLLIPILKRFIPVDANTLLGVFVLSILVTISAIFIEFYLIKVKYIAPIFGRSYQFN
ncbi:MAG: acyltransferase family protein [Gloeotrichia echinulata IR180]|jgi:fucose 4-O-acetylase-like acetyltransferase